MQDDFRAAAIKEVRRLTYYFALGAHPKNRFAFASFGFFALIHFFDLFDLFDLCQKHWAAVRQE